MTPISRRDFLKTLGAGAALWALPGASRPAQAAAPAPGARPNIVIIMADDMGFSDLGCYGSEIPTPNLDKLAAGGLRFTQFYNTAKCCPTRASLLTGLYSHQAGVGHMDEDQGPRNPGYRGFLNDRCVTIAEVLREAGYLTAMTGKWHVGTAPERWPHRRGFERSYVCPQGGGFYFKPAAKRSIALNGQVVYEHGGAQPPEGWYSTDAWTDNGIKFIDEAQGKGQPFFLYLAHNAPHYPLQAPADEIARFKGKYMMGWDKLREARHRRQLELGIVDPAWPLAPRDPQARPWDAIDTETREKLDLEMAIYAAVVTHLDRSVGRLVEALTERGILDNTLILFLSDNGGCAERGTEGSNAGTGTPGSADSYVAYGLSWANASNTPFRRYKSWAHEGGTAAPLIAHWPAVISQRGKLTDQVGHVIDLMATCCDVGGATYPGEYKSQPITPLEGKSLLPILKGDRRPGHEALFWEHMGNRAVRSGKWKLVARSGGPWELYDLERDRTELYDLAAENPEMVAELKAKWQAWARRANVVKAPRPQGAGKKGNGPGRRRAARRKAKPAAPTNAL